MSRLQQAADVLVQRLLGFALDGDAPDHVALAAIRDALDRAGMGAKQALEVSVAEAEPAPYEQLFAGIATLSRAESHAARGLPPIIDAEVVDPPALETPVDPAQGDVAVRTPVPADDRLTDYSQNRTEALTTFEEAITETHTHQVQKVRRTTRRK